MEPSLIEKNNKENHLIKIASGLALTLILGGFLLIGTIIVLNHTNCETATKDYKIRRENSADGTPTDLFMLPKKDQVKFVNMLDKCKAQRQFDSQVFSKSSAIYIVGLPLIFISVFLVVWAYVIVKYGLLIGGSIGVVPSLIISLILTFLWPLIILITLSLLTFKTQFIKFSKEKYLSPFRQIDKISKTDSNS